MAESKSDLSPLRQAVKKHWGFDTLRPLQSEAMTAMLQSRDSLVVLPTGGGKSLCYQAPAVVRGETAVVVSPLISLMKDQVDALLSNGVPAVAINSGQTSEERRDAEQQLQDGQARLCYVSPERLVLTGYQQFLRNLGVRTFVIDEAHCISHWGHDFRPDYRQLSQIKEWFPGSAVHAFTATATEQVRQDIIQQLRLANPEVLIGDFDRPNLTYRVLARTDLYGQTTEVLARHKGQAGIVYCIRRKDVDVMAEYLHAAGFKCRAYHAGLSPEMRKRAQEQFAAEKCDIVVATVAFGMGIDRSNIRFVLHTGMPKSVEHYQQETGRAGRDGLEAECVLLYSGADTMTWKWIMEKSAGDAEHAVDPNYLVNAIKHLEDMDRYSRGAICRHAALVRYFGQAYAKPTCQACDVCLGDAELVPDGQVIAQKILSCVARVKERFGVGQVVAVLHGENIEKVRKYGHEQLSTFGLMKEQSVAQIRDWVYQLIGQDVLVQEGDEYPILKLNHASWEVMKSQREVRLTQRALRETKKSKAEAASWEGVDNELFEAMRALRRELAEADSLQPYMVFSDATLRELARVRPSTKQGMRMIYGIGDAKLADYGDDFLAVIIEHCRDRGLTIDDTARPRRAEQASLPAPKPRQPNPQRDLAYKLFADGADLQDVIHQTQRSQSTVVQYLCQFIQERRPKSIRPWVTDEVVAKVGVALKKHGGGQLKPLFVELEEKVPYEEIRIAVGWLGDGNG